MRSFFEVFLRYRGHVYYDEAADQRLVELARAGVAVVHCGDEARGGVHLYPVIARHVNYAPEVQRGVQHGQGLVLRHVYLVEHAEAAERGALCDGAGAEADRAVLEGVRAYERGRIRIYVEAHVPARTPEGRGEALGQHVLAGGLGADEQQVFPAEQGGGRLLPDFLAVILKPRRLGHAPLSFGGHRVGAPELLYTRDYAGIYAFASQKVKHM